MSSNRSHSINKNKSTTLKTMDFNDSQKQNIAKMCADILVDNSTYNQKHSFHIRSMWNVNTPVSFSLNKYLWFHFHPGGSFEGNMKCPSVSHKYWVFAVPNLTLVSLIWAPISLSQFYLRAVWKAVSKIAFALNLGSI
jgi:hypothetical protein